MKAITIVGSGFAALTAVRELRRRRAEAAITLVAPRPEFHYLPSLIWIPARLREPAELVVPLNDFFAQHGVVYHRGEATGLADGGRTLLTSTGPVHNDALLIASGGRFLKKLPGIEHAITPCEGIPQAVAIRDRLEAMEGGSIAIGFAASPKEPQAVRGGPMFEFLFGIDTLLRRQRRREAFGLTFFSPAARPGNRLGDKAVDRLLREMKRRGIETHLGHKLVRFEPDKVVTEGGELASDLTLFMPGLTGPAWLDATELPRSPGGMIPADAHCRVPDWPRVYVAGDCGSFDGPDWMPKQAHMADLQARAAVTNMLAELDGRPATARPRVELVCIIDSLDRGTLVWRDPKRGFALPGGRPLHWLKRSFERHYLRQFHGRRDT